MITHLFCNGPPVVCCNSHTQDRFGYQSSKLLSEVLEWKDYYTVPENTDALKV